MRKTFIYTALLVFIAVFILSCKKEEKCTGGAGGNVTINVSLQHHEHILVNLKNYRDTIFVKYNVQEFPGTNPASYDAVYIGVYQQDHVLLTNLKCGNYYLYAVGMESTHFVRVTGGIPCNIGVKEGEVKLTIPVSE